MDTVGDVTLHTQPTADRDTAVFAGGRAADLRAVGVLMGVGGLLLPFGPDVDLPLCPLRAVTGVPCPFCGMTTATIAAVHGDIGGSLAANPAALVLLAVIATAFVPAVYRSDRFRQLAGRSRPWLARLPWLALPVLWMWQLERFGLVDLL